MKNEKNTKVRVTYAPNRLGHSLAQRLWARGLSEDRQVGTEADADIILFDDVRTAIDSYQEYPQILHIVIARDVPRGLPKGIFWLKPDIQAFTTLVRTLNPCDE